MSDFRTARAARLAALAGTTSAPTNPAPAARVAGTDELLTVKLAGNVAEIDPRTVDMALFNRDSSDPHYVLFASGEPFARVRLSQQPGADKLREAFCSAEYSTSFVRGCLAQGVSAMLQAVHGELYASQVQHHSALTTARAEIEAEVEQRYARHVDAAISDILKVASLVRRAQDKRLFVQDPLRQALFRSLHQKRGLAAESCLEGIVEALDEAGDSHFATVIDKAREWLDSDPKVLAQIQREIDGAAAPPLELQKHAETTERAESLAARAASASVPITPSGDGQPSDPFGSRVRSALRR